MEFSATQPPSTTSSVQGSARHDFSLMPLNHSRCASFSTDLGGQTSVGIPAYIYLMNAKLGLGCLVVVCWMSCAAWFAHKFYFSNVSVFLNPRTQITECTIKLFYDDLELALLQRSGKQLRFHEQSASEINPYLSEYIVEHFHLSFDNAAQSARWVGFEVEGDLVICYVEYVYPQSLHSLEVKNDILVAQFPDQKNVIQVEYNGSTQTILLDKNKTAQTVRY